MGNHADRASLVAEEQKEGELRGGVDAVMSKRIRFLCKGTGIKPGDKVKGIDKDSGEVTFYQVDRVWGSHATMKAIPKPEDESDVVSLKLEPDVR